MPASGLGVADNLAQDELVFRRIRDRDPTEAGKIFVTECEAIAEPLGVFVVGDDEDFDFWITLPIFFGNRFRFSNGNQKSLIAFDGLGRGI